MADLVERVARTIADWHQKELGVELGGFDGYTDDGKQAALAEARAIIPLIEANERERCAQAVRALDFRGQGLPEETGDEQYLEAIDEAERAIRSMKGTLDD